MQSDAWMATWFFCLLLFTWVTERRFSVSMPCMLFLACSLIPWLQYCLGVLPYSGQVWIGFAYVAGAAVALWLGTVWGAGKRAEIGDTIFLAIGIASIASVGINICQWLSLVEGESMETWVMAGSPIRAISNLAQPNQTSTLLVWGIAAQLWALARNKVREPVFLLATIWLLFGIVLTQSRTGILELAALMFLLVWHRKTIGIQRRLIVKLASCILTASVLMLLWPSINAALGLGDGMDALKRLAGEPRPTQWMMLLRGAALNPWLGYGWNQVVAAQLALEKTPAVLDHMLFAQSHNVFLDLIIWCGFPLGLLLGGALLIFSLKCISQRLNAQVLPFCVVFVAFSIHSMLEYPFQYAYFLFPAMLCLGVLHAGMAKGNHRSFERWTLVPLIVTYAVVGSAIIVDAFRMEDSWRSVRLRISGIWISEEQARLPDLPMLSHMRQVFIAEKYELRTPMPTQDVEWLKTVVNILPSSLNMMKLSAALAIQGRLDESRQWQEKICRLAPPSQCQTIGQRWKMLEMQFPALAKVPWPLAHDQPAAAAEAEK
jgi:O-Antigen ligase/Virulence factor membrane-bound polymerase, C-terminal